MGSSGSLIDRVNVDGATDRLDEERAHLPVLCENSRAWATRSSPKRLNTLSDAFDRRTEDLNGRHHGAALPVQ
jgi:hypothetical protein